MRTYHEPCHEAQPHHSSCHGAEHGAPASASSPSGTLYGGQGSDEGGTERAGRVEGLSFEAYALMARKLYLCIRAESGGGPKGWGRYHTVYIEPSAIRREIDRDWAADAKRKDYMDRADFDG